MRRRTLANDRSVLGGQVERAKQSASNHMTVRGTCFGRSLVLR